MGEGKGGEGGEAWEGDFVEEGGGLYGCFLVAACNGCSFIPAAKKNRVGCRRSDPRLRSEEAGDLLTGLTVGLPSTEELRADMNLGALR